MTCIQAKNHLQDLKMEDGAAEVPEQTTTFSPYLSQYHEIFVSCPGIYLNRKPMPEQRSQEKQLYRTRNKTAEQQRETPSPEGRKCPNCSNPVKDSWEFCPVCGISLVPWCTFCGAEIPPGEQECPECGMSRKGTECPRCGTLNSRSFCRKCNEPLTPAARRELERAKKDPLFLRAAELAVKLAELFPEGDNDTDTPDGERRKAELPADILRLKELLAAVKLSSATGGTESSAVSTGNSSSDSKSSSPGADTGIDRDKMRAEYEKMKAELNSILESMVPPAGSTPQEQRNYYSARKIPVLKKVRSRNPVAWVCNFCGCWHNKPSECCEPWHGGTWIFEEKTITEFKEL